MEIHDDFNVSAFHTELKEIQEELLHEIGIELPEDVVARICGIVLTKLDMPVW